MVPPQMPETIGDTLDKTNGLLMLDFNVATGENELEMGESISPIPRLVGYEPGYGRAFRFSMRGIMDDDTCLPLTYS